MKGEGWTRCGEFHFRRITESSLEMTIVCFFKSKGDYLLRRDPLPFGSFPDRESVCQDVVGRKVLAKA